MRVLHCPSDTGNQAYGLSRAERRLGIDSDLMVYKEQWYAYPNDIRLWEPGHSKLRRAPYSLLRPLPSRPPRKPLPSPCPSGSTRVTSTQSNIVIEIMILNHKHDRFH